MSLKALVRRSTVLGAEGDPSGVYRRKSSVSKINVKTPRQGGGSVKGHSAQKVLDMRKKARCFRAAREKALGRTVATTEQKLSCAEKVP